MFVRVTAKAATREEADALCAPVVEEIRRRVGNFVYIVDIDTLEETVVRELIRQGKTLATAESCTGGLLAKRITDIPGASAAFEMGGRACALLFRGKARGHGVHRAFRRERDVCCEKEPVWAHKEPGMAPPHGGLQGARHGAPVSHGTARG